MTILHTSSKLIAYGLLIASLVLPSTTFAEEQEKASSELAPGFNMCEKSAADTAKNSAEYRVALSVCLNLAEKHWEGILQKENKYYMEMYEDVSDSQYKQQTVKDLQKAWLQYKEAGSELIRSDGDQVATIRARYFDVQETRRQAERLSYGLDRAVTEELAPGFDICVKKATDSTSTQSEFNFAVSECLDAAHQYLEPILNKNYNIYMNLYKDSPEVQKKLQNFQKAWKQYVEAGMKCIRADGGRTGGITAKNFENEETIRQARMLESSGSRW